MLSQPSQSSQPPSYTLIRTALVTGLKVALSFLALCLALVLIGAASLFQG
jgi:hypothetical protein